MTWRDLTITPAIQFVILVVSILCVVWVNRVFPLGVLAMLGLWYVIMIATTLIVLKSIRAFLPILEGTYSYRRHPVKCWVWNLHGYLCATNLFLHYSHGLVPDPLKKLFYVLLGARMGKGIINIAGLLFDPFLITIESNAVIGQNALLLAHLITTKSSEDVLILGRIEIKHGALIGAGAILSPGVIVGEHAVVMAMSFVAPHDKIPPGEIWGGIPARRIKCIAD